MSATSISDVEAGLAAAGVPSVLAHEVVEAYQEAKRRFHLNDFMPNAVEGGRFSEAVLRILQWATTGSFTPLADPKFKAESVINQLPAAAGQPESIRLHVPRAVRVIYDIRNKRNTAHLSDGIDPNVQDASIVVAVMGWILAELVRLYHSVPPLKAQQMIEALVSREVPMIQVFDDRPRILKTIPASDHVLVLVYWAGAAGVDRKELSQWVPAPMRANLLRTLNQLHDKHLIHFIEPLVRITIAGQQSVESRQLVQPL